MRFAVASIASALALAACGALYDVDSTSPDARGGDAPGDAPGGAPDSRASRDAPSLDAPAPGSGSAGSDTCTFAQTSRALSSSTSDEFYVTSMTGATAVWIVGPNGAIQTGDPASDTAKMLDAAGAFQMPRLEPNGTWFIAVQGSRYYEVAASTGEAGPELTGLVGMPGTPNDKDDDIIMDEGAGMLREYTRPTTSSTWTPGASITSVPGAREPSLSADGLRVVFAGDSAGEQAIYTATRAAVGDAFGVSHVLYATGVGGAPTTPFVNADCTVLTFSAATNLYSVSGTL